MHFVRRGLAAVLMLAALAFAGCTDTSSEPLDGPDTGTDGGDLGAGGDGGSPGAGFAPQQGTDESTSDAFPGIVLTGRYFACAAGYCLEATARNDGDATYHVSSICIPPWSDRMARDGEAVAHREPQAYCMAFGTRPFGPGDEQVFEAEWDETVWNDASGTYEPAPTGGYDWTAEFHVSHDADGGGTGEIALRFHVLVGAAT